jgi:hypothetical protein
MGQLKKITKPSTVKKKHVLSLLTIAMRRFGLGEELNKYLLLSLTHQDITLTGYGCVAANNPMAQ